MDRDGEWALGTTAQVHPCPLHELRQVTAPLWASEPSAVKKGFTADLPLRVAVNVKGRECVKCLERCLYTGSVL